MLVKENLWFTNKIVSCSNDDTKLDNSFLVEFVMIRARFPQGNISEIIVERRKKGFHLKYTYSSIVSTLSS